MEDGNYPVTKTEEEYGYRAKSSLADAGTKKFSKVNGHSLNGIDLINSTLSGCKKRSFIERDKLIEKKNAHQQYPKSGRKHDLKNNNFNQTRLSGCSTTLPLIADNVPSIHKKLNNMHSHETQPFNSSLGYYDGCHKRTDDINMLSLDRNKNKTNSNGDKHSNVHKPMKFKCLKCKAITFKSLGLLKEHQRECRNVMHKPSSSAVDPKKVVSRKVYMCSVCNTYYENWNLFLHMREVHNRHICLFCLGMFSKAERLASHLIVKHSVSENKFSDIKDFFSVYSGSLLLMCCYCDKVHTEKDNFTFHDCVKLPKNALASNPIPKNHNISPFNTSNQINVGNKDNITESPKRSLTCHSPKNLGSANCDNRGEIKTPYSEKTVFRENCEKGITLDNEQKEDFCGDYQKEELSCEVEHGLKIESLDVADEDLDNEVRNITKGISESNDSKNAHSMIPDCADWNAVETDVDIKPFQIESKNNNEIERLQLKLAPKIASSSLSVAVNKPPKRNRRPPKRYDIEDANVPIEKNISISENFECNSGVAEALIHNLETEISKKCRRPLKRYEIEDVNLTTEKQYSFSENFECGSAVGDAPIQSLEIPIPKLKVRLNKVPNTSLASESVSDQEQFSISEDNHHILDDSNKFPIVETSCNDFSDESKGGDNDDQNESKILSCTEFDIDVAADDVPLIELTLDRPLDKYPIHTLLKTFLNSTVHSCIYCNHARKIAVHVKQLALHFLSQHRFSAIVNSITAEELLPETLSLKIKMCLNELSNSFLNLETYDSDDKTLITDFDHIFECFQCYFVTTAHKDLYVHHRKMHQKTISLCVMCKSTFHSYSELICHLCPGNNQNGSEMSYRCCLCQIDALPSAFRLMVHLRKRHHACDVCLEKCHNQSKLSNHVWKHKLNHLCYRCGVAYCNKPDITKHLFWKHGTESVLCKKCMQKKWPHVYHFCIPPNTFACDECSLSFSKAVALKVHKRLHSGDTPYCCVEENCCEKFISKRLLEKHSITHRETPGEAIPICDKNCSNDIKMTEELVPAVEIDSNENIPSLVNVTEDKTKTKKAKRDKKNKEIKDKENLLMDVNLPALNLSESDSSEESEVEDLKYQAKGSTNITDPMQPEVTEVNCDIPKEPDVLQIWDNFNQYQAEVQKHTKEIVIVKRHVCDSDHDYCLKEIEDSNQTTESNVKLEKRTKSHKKKGKGKSKKKHDRDGHLSLSDSSSDSDTSCSCASNCSCSSSSGTSSSGSTSSDSDSSINDNKRAKKSLKRSYNKGSDTSPASPVDIMATEEPIPSLISDSLEIHIPESDLVTDETDTDEDFYDEHPQRMGAFLMPERRSPVILSTVDSPIENGSLSCPVSPKTSDKKKKRIKPKRKRKGKESLEQIMMGTSPSIKTSSVPNVLQNKITISLQKNTVQLADVSMMNNEKEMSFESDSKRASKRKRVPNKFYGYSSDEEYGFKPQLPPKLEWRKEDLPSPTPSPSFTKSIAPVVPEPPKTIPPLIIPKPVMSSHISSDDSDDSSVEGELQICQQQTEVNFNHKRPPKQGFHSGSFKARFPKPPGVRQAREGESVYCYCRCPYDEVSEMIACDGTGCNIEWFHFECVGILVPPKGKWYCPQCESKLHPS